jgi:membrane fusion protein (multidrug efflux system)
MKSPHRYTLGRLFQKSGFLLILLLLIGFGCGKETQQAAAPIEVPVVPVIKKEVALTREYVGQTYGAEDIELKPRVSGWITGIHFTEGSEVKKGQLLYSIDPLPYQTKVDQARGGVAEADAGLAKAQSDYDRTKPLAEQNAVSQKDLVAADAALKAAKAQKVAAEANLQNSGIELGYAKIYSPINGVIGISKSQVGDYVGGYGTSSVNTVSSIDQIKVRFSISEAEYLQFRKQRAAGEVLNTATDLILSDGSVHPQKGNINLANREIDPETGTLTLQASFPNPDKLIRPGQYARVRFVVKVLKDALLVPQRAVTELQGTYQVMTVTKDNKIQIKVVEAGERYEDYWIIQKGLQEGDRIALAGNMAIRADATITPLEEPAKP